MSRRIEIIEYRSSWPAEFAALGARLRAALPPRAGAIHHVGSTSVPGLAAKDVIDVQVTVASLDDPGLLEAIGSAGFEWTDYVADHRPPGLDLPDDELAKRTASAVPGERPANLHVRVAGRYNQRYPLLFRDYLRSHPPAAAAYAGIKHHLARLHPRDATAYYAVKDPVCDLIVVAAESWAAASGWPAPASDA